MNRVAPAQPARATGRGRASSSAASGWAEVRADVRCNRQRNCTRAPCGAFVWHRRSRAADVPGHPAHRERDARAVSRCEREDRRRSGRSSVPRRRARVLGARGGSRGLLAPRRSEPFRSALGSPRHGRATRRRAARRRDHDRRRSAARPRRPRGHRSRTAHARCREQSRVARTGRVRRSARDARRERVTRAAQRVDLVPRDGARAPCVVGGSGDGGAGRACRHVPRHRIGRPRGRWP